MGQKRKKIIFRLHFTAILVRLYSAFETNVEVMLAWIVVRISDFFIYSSRVMQIHFHLNLEAPECHLSPCLYQFRACLCIDSVSDKD